MVGTASFDLFWTRAKSLGKGKGPERDMAPGPCLVSKDYKKDIFSILADGVELLHKRLSLLYITFNFMAADKNYLYFLF